MKTLATLVILSVAALGADNVTYNYDAAGRLTSATYSNGLTISYGYDKAGNLLSRNIQTGPAAAPVIGAGGVVNAASFTAPLARGELASIFGSNLASATAQAGSLPLPTSLGNVQVSVSGIPAPLLVVSPGQINFQVPFEVPSNASVNVIVTLNGTPSAPSAVAVADYAPGIYTYARTAAVTDPIIVHSATNTLITPTSPATANETIVIYANGIGALDHPPATGGPSAASPLAQSLVLPTVTVGGTSAIATFAGLTPGLVGLVQINVQLPAQLPAGGSLPLVVKFGSASAQTVNLYVQ